MRSIYSDVRRRGGVAATFELLADGHTSHSLTAAVRSGEITRIRQGHYGCPELSLAEQQAVCVGGRLTGTSGARHYKIWAPQTLTLTLTVSVGAHARGLRSKNDAGKKIADTPARSTTAVAWMDRSALGTLTALEPLECVRQIALTESEAVAFAAAESALFLGHFSVSRWRATVNELPRRVRRRLARAGRLSGSGGESLTRLHFMDLGLDVRQQVPIVGVGKVDFLIGARLVVEIDGAEFHTSREAFEEDRRRDAVLRSLGYRVMRFSYRQVESRWHEVEAAILAAVSSGDHID